MICIEGAAAQNVLYLLSARSRTTSSTFLDYDTAAEFEFAAAAVIFLFNPCSVPCFFPVRSLLRIISFREKSRKHQ
jgi:hypothetical protein